MALFFLLLSLPLLSSVANGVEQNANVSDSLDRSIISLLICPLRRPDREPEIPNMGFILSSPAGCGKATRISLTHPQNLWNSTFFSHDRPTVIYLMGWTTSLESSGPQAMVKVFACRNDTNFIVSIFLWLGNNSI